MASLPGRQSDTHRNFSPSSAPRISCTVKKKISIRGVLHIQSLYFVFVLLSFFSFVLFASFRKTQKKNSFIFSTCFSCLVLALLECLLLRTPSCVTLLAPTTMISSVHLLLH